MMKISIELVPRDEKSLLADLEIINKHFPVFNTVNIPDLLRFSIRSWEGCKCAKKYYSNLVERHKNNIKHHKVGRSYFDKTNSHNNLCDVLLVPHIRAIDINPEAPLPMADFLREHKIKDVLVLTGDPPQDMTKKIYPSTSNDIIKKLKKEMPDIKVYAAIDQYRNSLRKEFDYIKRKMDAGADGFFTQPFFDLRFLEIYAELLEDIEVFWGISPVTSEKSVNYWETKNNVVFPNRFQPSMEWNIKFAQRAMEFIKETKQHLYVMLIRTNIFNYLKGIFG